MDHLGLQEGMVEMDNQDCLHHKYCLIHYEDLGEKLEYKDHVDILDLRVGVWFTPDGERALVQMSAELN